MTCRERLESYLHRQQVPFGVHPHPTARTAHDLAAQEHLSEQLVAKVVVVAADGSFALLVLPAARRLAMGRVAGMLNAREVRLASEGELAELFPDCELGAIPPFGELYGLPVYVDRSLEPSGAIFFPAGTHTTALSVAYGDFRRIAAPTIADFTSPPHDRSRSGPPLVAQGEASDTARGAPTRPASALQPSSSPGDKEAASSAVPPILVPLDGSPFGEHALSMAIALAEFGGRGITLAHAHTYITPVITPLGAQLVSSSLDAETREREEAYLQEVARRMRTAWDGPISQVVLDAPVATAINRHATALGAGLIVLTTHGRGGAARAWLGSVADQLIRHAPVPVVAVRPGEGAPDFAQPPPLRNILIPLDGSRLAEQALDLAVRAGLPAQARYILLHVVPAPRQRQMVGAPEGAVNVEAAAEAWEQATSYLNSVAARLHTRSLAVIPEVRSGGPAPAILEAVADHAIDLIVMTTHGRGGVARVLLGSVADKVLRGATVPLLVCRPDPAVG